MMQELQAQINNQKADVKLYTASKGGFILTTTQEYEDDDGNMQMVDTQIYLNQYFYVTAEYISSGTVYEEIMIEWAA